MISCSVLLDKILYACDALVARVRDQSCPTLCDPMDCSLSGSSFLGIFQTRILEWVAIPFSNALARITFKKNAFSESVYIQRPNKSHLHHKIHLRNSPQCHESRRELMTPLFTFPWDPWRGQASSWQERHYHARHRTLDVQHGARDSTSFTSRFWIFVHP